MTNEQRIALLERIKRALKEVMLSYEPGGDRWLIALDALLKIEADLSENRLKSLARIPLI